MTGRERRLRLDLVMKVIASDRKENTLEVILEPHPRRYEWKEEDGKRWLHDKLDDLWFPEDVFFELLTKQAQGMPIRYQRQQIDSAEAYVNGRLSCIHKMLTCTETPIDLLDKSEEFLSSLATDNLEFAILSLDIVGSTRLSTAMPPERYSRLIRTTVFELSAVVPEFHGHVLKYTGDGLTAYFPAPSFIRMNDLAIDCASTMHLLVYKGINPILQGEGYQPIDIRIGIDSGEACIVAIGSPETKRHRDIIGSVVNLASKIQGIAGVGKIALGDTTLRSLHTMWREICEEIPLEIDWPYKDQDGNPYRVHRIIEGKRLKSVSGSEE